MYCTACGGEVPDGAGFCTSCGAKVAGATAPPATAPPAEDAAAAPSSRRRGTLAFVIAGAVVLLAVGGVAAVSLGLADGLLGKTTATSSTSSTSEDKDDEGTEANPAADEDGEAVPVGGGGLPEGHPAIGGGTPLSGAESYALLSEHYASVWKLHVRIGVQDGDSYTGTGFVYEPGGFNESIGHSDKPVREELVERCRRLVEEVRTSKDELTAKTIDLAYEGQRSALLGLYDALLMRGESMYDAAVVAVDKPAREDGWGDKLQPRSKEGRQRFEADYPGSEPREL